MFFQVSKLYVGMGGVAKLAFESMLLFDVHWFIMNVRFVEICGQHFKVVNLLSVVRSSLEEQLNHFSLPYTCVCMLRVVMEVRLPLVAAYRANSFSI